MPPTMIGGCGALRAGGLFIGCSSRPRPPPHGPPASPPDPPPLGGGMRVAEGGRVVHRLLEPVVPALVWPGIVRPHPVGNLKRLFQPLEALGRWGGRGGQATGRAP